VRLKIIEMLKPNRVFMVTLISLVLDMAMFRGVLEFIQKEKLSSRKLAEQQPKEIRP
jgi:hypothetical protein